MMAEGHIAKPDRDRQKEMVRAWEASTGNRWDRLPERTATQARAYMQRAQGRPDIRFCVFAQGRTGSSLLQSLLNTHPDVHCDGEILGPKPVLFPMAYVQRYARLTAERAFGFKVKSYQLTRHQGIADPRAFMEGLVDHGYAVLHLSRRNLLRHAISNLYALQSGAYHYRQDEGATRPLVEVDPAEVVRVMRRREGHAAMEAEILANIDAHPITYEDDLLDPSRHQPTVDGVLGILGLDPVPVSTRYTRSVSGRVKDSVANYDALAQALEEAGFGEYLDDSVYG